MLNDVTISAEVTLSAATCNFDLGEKTLSYPNASGNVSALVIATNSNVTMTNGTVNYHSTNTKDNDWYAVQVKGTLNLGNETADSNKTLEMNATGIASNVFINGGTLNVNNDATITQDQAGAYGIVYNWESNVTSHCNINGGTVISHSTAVNPSYGAIFFAGKQSTFNMSSGRVNYDGTSYCTISTDYLNNGSFTMTGGTLENTYTGGTTAGAFELYQIKDVNITGGTISSTRGHAIFAYQSATIGGTATITGGNTGIATHYKSNMNATVTITDSANISGGNAGILLRENSTINVESATITGGISVTDGTNNPATGTVNVKGGTIDGNISNTATGASTVAISGGNVTGNVVTDNTNATTAISGGEIKGNVSNISGTTQVKGGTISGNVAEELIADGYKIENGVIKADAKWVYGGEEGKYHYVLNSSPSATIVTATGVEDSMSLKDDTQYRLLGVPDSVTVGEPSDTLYALAKYTTSEDGATMNIAPQSETLIRIIGKNFVDDTTKTLTITGNYGIYVDATDNNLENITGSGGNDSIKAGARDSTLNGADGDDTLEGNTGDDLFIYTKGKDVINNYEYGNDTVTVTSDLTPSVDLDKTSFNNGSDLSITFDDDNSLVFLKAAKVEINKGDSVYTYEGNAAGMNYVAFNSKTEHGISLGAGYSGRFNGANAANEDYATIDASHVTGAIRVTGNDNNNYMVAGTGGGTFEGGAGNDIINGASATSSLRFVGGAGDDSLVGGSGYNVFVYTEGNDKIKDYHDGDLVNVNNSVNLANAEFSLSGNNFILGFGSGDSLTLENVASVTSGVSIQSGSSSKNIYVYKKDSIARNKSITLTSGFAADSLNFAAGDNYDTINAVAVGHAISIDGNDNNNVIFGSKQGGTLFGGAGKDKLDVTERDSGKTFVFKYTEGKDTVSGFVAGDKLEITADKIGKITKAKSSRSDTRLAFTFNTSKSDVLTFNSEDEIGSVSINGSDAYLTKDGIVSIGGSNSASLNLFASARGKIDLTEAPYVGTEIKEVNAENVKKQSVTLIGASVESGSSYTFAGNNKKKDLFEYNGGNVSISGYEAGVDRLDLNTAALSGFSVGADGGDVSLSAGSNTVVLESMQGHEVLLHHAESKRNSFTKMVFKDTGVILNKEKRPTMATVSENYAVTTDTTVKKIFVADGADNISITAGDRNKTTLDASASNGGVTLTGGAKNDKLIGSTDAADTFVYTAGKDIIQNYNSNDEISLGDFASSLTSAKINAGKRSIKFKFSNKNALTVKPTKGSTLGSALNISEFNGYTYAKNAIAQGSNASLTSEFSGSYRLKNSGVNNVDGSRVEKNLTFRGTSADETLSGGTKKTTFKGGGGNDAFTGGSGKDVFFYAKGDSGDATIADFDFTNDKLKIASGTITKISTVNGGIKFDMNNGRKNSANIGSFTIGNIADGYENGNAKENEKTAIIKANNTYYWFAEGPGKDANGDAFADGALITSVNRVSKSDTTGYAVIDLGYSSNLVNAGVAYKTEQTLTKLSNNDD